MAKHNRNYKPEDILFPNDEKNIIRLWKKKSAGEDDLDYTLKRTRLLTSYAYAVSENNASGGEINFDLKISTVAP